MLHNGRIRSPGVYATYLSLWVRMLDAPLLNLIKTSLMCLFVTEVKYDSKEMEILNILYMVNLVLLLMCLCQFWLWQSISLCLNALMNVSRFCTPCFSQQIRSQICTRPDAPVTPNRTCRYYAAITAYCKPFVVTLKCPL